MLAELVPAPGATSTWPAAGTPGATAADVLPAGVALGPAGVGDPVAAHPASSNAAIGDGDDAAASEEGTSKGRGIHRGVSCGCGSPVGTSVWVGRRAERSAGSLREDPEGLPEWLMPLVVFVVAAALSAGSSVLLVSRLERVGERLGLAEALLGLVVALAADGPEITSALTAVTTGQREIGLGVVLGSNAFNLAAMLGLSVVVAGGLRLPRFATILEGSIALLIAAIAVAAVMAWIAPIVGLLLALVVFLPYVLVCALRPAARARLPLPRLWLTWLQAGHRPGARDHRAPARGRSG